MKLGFPEVPLKSKSQWKNFLKKLFPIYLLAAITPFLLVAVTNPDVYSLFSQAAKARELSLWLEPEAVTIHPGQTIKLKLMAEVEPPVLVQQLRVTVNGEGLRVNPQTISQADPFQGRSKVSEVEISGGTAGTYTLSVDETTLTYQASDHITTHVSSATITVAAE